MFPAVKSSPAYTGTAASRKTAAASVTRAACSKSEAIGESSVTAAHSAPHTGVLSVQTIVANSAEMAGGKAAKMLVSGAIPIVGSAFSDAFSVIVSGAALVKNGVGAFGLLASLAIFLPLCIKAAAWLLICFCAGLAAEVLGLKPLASFLNGCAAALRLLIAAVCSVGAVAVVSAAVVLCVRGAYA